MALTGIPLNCAVSGLSQKTMPPARLTSWMPREPSLPLPERITATARSPRSCASERRKRSIGSVRPCRGSLSLRSRRRLRIVISLVGGIRYTELGSTCISCSASRTGIGVRRERSSDIRLLKSGERCWTTTKAIPVSGGRRENSRSRGSSPPAEAPMPTTWKSLGWSSCALPCVIRASDRVAAELDADLSKNNSSLSAGGEEPQCFDIRHAELRTEQFNYVPSGNGILTPT